MHAAQARDPVFRFLALGDVLGDTGDAIDLASLVPNGEGSRVDPADRAVRTNDPIFSIHLAGRISLPITLARGFQIVRMNRFRP